MALPTTYKLGKADAAAFVDLARFHQRSSQPAHRQQFGHTHALMLAETFYENVDDGKGGSKELQFRPRASETMYIACLYSHWTDPKAEEPELWSFAAITDEPEPEVAAAGHDRTIINIKPEYVDAWLIPEGRSEEELFAIFDDRRHPYYEIVKEAAGFTPEPAGAADAAAAGIALSAVAGTVAANYQNCHENAEQLRALQTWVKEMK